MKKFKLAFAFIPALVIAAVIYFSISSSTVSASVEKPVYFSVDKNGNITKTMDAPSNVCYYRIIPDMGAMRCSCEQYFVCIGGTNGYYVSSGSPFYVTLTEGVTTSVCVQCGTCAGSVTITSGVPTCGFVDTHVTMNANSACNCSGS